MFLRPGTTDMRTSKEELLHVINDLMEQDPFGGAVFMFCIILVNKKIRKQYFKNIKE
ncbi:MAG: IS66 family insertion sequence element accessory protein TnpB [Candidatus Gastranaerophilaceae bacterium]|nr:IS66 family insertion sequence element accessory protein TnpB [Candidatus Gastranaerophilaceae bacterium]